MVEMVEIMGVPVKHCFSTTLKTTSSTPLGIAVERSGDKLRNMEIKDTLLAILILLSITLIATAAKDEDEKDDDDDDDGGQPDYCPDPNGMYPNPTDCATFFNCVDGQAIAMSCAPGLLFDPETKMCNFANQVKCKNECRGPNGMFPSQHRCDEFVLCTNNKPKVQRCKKGLYFDANLQVCNYKDQVLCTLPGGGKKNKTTGNDKDKGKNKGGGMVMEDMAAKMRAQKELAMASVRSVCPKARGLFAHAESCNMYYQCYDGEVLAKSCPEGLLFDNEKHSCAYGKDVECGERRRMSKSKSSSEEK
ncbi:hypothetical protein TNCT_174501 [Trichonephila clavata]|uniref:Chitin-binding type-2 domain-containing protein n=1 Tax=Trichonephila clavata TaxID=2740835 RepID=A0A8X6M1X8_TRICU|nr:hypothetical protein TNCT_174501 [Trichonephila clavata]